MDFEWDEGKNAANIAKHGLDFADAVLIFDGPVVSHVDSRRDYGETRVISYGQIANLVVATVVHTDRSGVTRIISARLASAKERRLYEKAL
ncbi:MAG: BrnT family toxin [Sphingobium sp.]|nr:BrnT family toxin [Sphingobium sp.]